LKLPTLKYKEHLAAAQKGLAKAEKVLHLPRDEFGEWVHYPRAVDKCHREGYITHDQSLALLEWFLLSPWWDFKQSLEEHISPLQKETNKIGPRDPKFDPKAFSDDLFEREASPQKSASPF